MPIFGIVSISGFASYDYSNRAFKLGDNAKKGTIHFGGFVNSTDGKLDKAAVKVFVGNKEIHRTATKKGKFTLNLPKNIECTIVVSKDGYFSKSIALNTRMKNQKIDQFKFELEFNLFNKKDISQASESFILDFPVAKIGIDPQKGFYDMDKQYSRNMKLMIAELLEGPSSVDKKNKSVESKNKQQRL